MVQESGGGRTSLCPMRWRISRVSPHGIYWSKHGLHQSRVRNIMLFFFKGICIRVHLTNQSIVLNAIHASNPLAPYKTCLALGLPCTFQTMKGLVSITVCNFVRICCLWGPFPNKSKLLIKEIECRKKKKAMQVCTSKEQTSWNQESPTDKDGINFQVLVLFSGVIHSAPVPVYSSFLAS